MMNELSAANLYGVPLSAQPSASGVAEHPAGTPEPTMRTAARPTADIAGNPVFVLVALLGAALLILNLSVRGQVSIGVGK